MNSHKSRIKQFSKIPINNIDKLNKKCRFLQSNLRIKKYNDNPYIVRIKNFITDDEIKEVFRLLKKKDMEKSTIINSNGDLQESDYRRSYTCYIMENGLPEKYSQPLENLINRICYLSSCKRSQIEGLMVVKYKSNEKGYFWDHWDYFDEDKYNFKLDDAGQRILTYFVYLNTLDKKDGGETEFPRLNIKCRPIKGNAIAWWNKIDNELLTDTLHRGNPVRKTKYGLNIWIREKGF